MWTPENRKRYNRDHLRYPSNLTDEEWALVAPLIPPAKTGGRKRTVDLRQVLNGIMYILSTGCGWRYIPREFGSRTTIYDYFQFLDYEGALDRIHQTLYILCREKANRDPSPTACVIDSQSVKSAEKGGSLIDPHGYDAGKKIDGKKRQILVDTEGLPMRALVHPADIQDRDGGVLLLATLIGLYPFLKKIFADSAYQGPIFATAVAALLPNLAIEIVKRSDLAKGFVILPRRWVVERTIAWLNRCRRLAKDWENLTRNALAFVKLAAIRLMIRRICNH